MGESYCKILFYVFYEIDSGMDMDIKNEKIGDASYGEGGKSCISMSVNRFTPHR